MVSSILRLLIQESTRHNTYLSKKKLNGSYITYLTAKDYTLLGQLHLTDYCNTTNVD